MLIPYNSTTFHMDDTLFKQLDLAKKRIVKNKDNLILVCGDPGNGKSTLGSQVMYVMSPTTKEEMCFHSTVESYQQYMIRLQDMARQHEKPDNYYTKGRAIAHDEARESGSINVLSARIKRFWDFIYENRFLGMNQVLIQANFWNIPRDIIYHRALFMVWVVEDVEWSNGEFYFFSKHAMKRLYQRGKMTKDLEPKGWDFQGRFVDFWAGHPDYLKQKGNNFFEKYKPKEEEEENKINDRQFIMAALDRLMFEDKFNVTRFCDDFGISRDHFYKVKREYMKLYNDADTSGV